MICSSESPFPEYAKNNSLIITIFCFNRELKRVLLLIENFVPEEVKERLCKQAYYDEEREEWAMNPSRVADNQPIRRPIAHPSRRRPMSDYALKAIEKNDENAIHLREHNIIMYELDMPLRTTEDYKNPKVSATLQAVLNEAMKTEGDLIMEQVCINLLLLYLLEHYLDSVSSLLCSLIRIRCVRV